MSYKTISIVVTDEATDRAALAAAVGLALREGAHLDVICLGVDPARYETLSVGTTAYIIEADSAQAREQAESLTRWVEKALPQDLTKAAVQTVVVSNIGLDTLVARMTRYSDLIVAGLPYGAGRSPLKVTVVEAQLFGTGAPVMIVPDGAHDWGSGFGKVMVAWNEGEESLGAIRKALPVLIAARHVDIVMVDPPSHSTERSDPGGAVTLMLARHGVKAEVSILSKTLPRVSEVLLRFARERGSEAIVMGAYGHSRFRESILGGATRDMLENTPLPILMAR
jgi:nucleotide-binding universal stress UspA family protein